MKLQVGVKVLLQNKAGEYLLLKRSNKRYGEVSHPWDIPGGRIHPGAPLIDNLRREVAEETSLEISSEPRLVYAQDILKSPEKHVVRLTYTAETRGGPVRLDGEHTEHDWLTLNEIQNREGVDEFTHEVVCHLLTQ